MPREQSNNARRVSNWLAILLLAVLVAIFTWSITSARSDSGSLVDETEAAVQETPRPHVRGQDPAEDVQPADAGAQADKYRVAADRCTKHLSSLVAGSIEFIEAGQEKEGWQPWTASDALRKAHDDANAAGVCSADTKPPPADAWRGPKLPEHRKAACVKTLADGRQCVPAGCREVDDADRCAGQGATGGTRGVETLPPWAIIPTCEVIERCPVLKGWPAQDHTLCTSQTAITHCLAGLPAPADPSLLVTTDTIQYTPSAFEKEWYTNIMDKYNGNPPNICPLQLTYQPQLETWVSTTEGWFAGETARVHKPQFDETIFSTMTTQYTKPDGSTASATVPIEPLAANLRHPFSVCPHPNQNKRSLFNWEYVVTEHAGVADFETRYPGRKIFIDLGMTWFDERPKQNAESKMSDGRSFVELFSKMGMEFDLVYGWEPREDAGPLRFFKGMTDSTEMRRLVPKYCSINRLSNSLPGSAENAIELISQIWRPGDYIVFKLDIDHGETELAIVEELKKCPHTVAEFIFEYHCRVPELVRCCWTISVLPDARGNYHTALEKMTELREMGIRAHFWV